MVRGAILLAMLLSLAGCGEEPRARRVAPSPAPHPRQAAEAERVGFPVEVANDLGMRFRLLPRGAFRMGSSADLVEGHRDDETLHEVRLVTPSFLQTTEVTNAQFRAFRPAHDSGRAPDGRSLDGEGMPVVGITHDDAVAFAAWLQGRDPRWIYRLPTEAEWEFACRADAETAAGVPHPLGIHDLRGGVAEWCHDRYGPYAAWRQDNPQGSTTGGERVVRGGATRDGESCRPAAAREHHPPEHRSARIGFRLAFGLGYARHDFGAHEVRFVTVDPTAGTGEDAERPGYAMRMISVVDRLTDRQNAPDQRPLWTDVPRPAPATIRLWPGRYYVYCHREKDGRWSRGLEVKFDVPDRREILVPVPREDQVAPQ